MALALRSALSKLKILSSPVGSTTIDDFDSPINRSLHTGRPAYSNIRPAKSKSDMLAIKPNLRSIKNLRAEIAMPDRPKRPVNPWAEFVKEKSPGILRQSPGITAPELARKIKALWADTDKSSYQESYKRRLEEYNQSKENWMNSLNEEQLQYLPMERLFNRELKAFTMLRRTNQPVRPRNARNIYLHERFQHPEMRGYLASEGLQNAVKKAHADYLALNDAERQRYTDLALKDKDRYRNEFNEWYERVSNDKSIPKSARDMAAAIKEREKKYLTPDEK